jgi:hypothetical protein
VRRERVAPLSAIKVIYWSATVPITLGYLDSVMFVRGTKDILIPTIDDMGFLGQ